MTLLYRFIREDCAATAVEYALLIGVIGGVLAVAFGALSGNLQAIFELLASKMTG